MFWDSSALIPLFLPDTRSEELVTILDDARDLTIWWGSPVECLSAIYRRHRAEPLPAPVLTNALERLRAFVEDTHGIAPTEEVRRRAGRLLGAHPLRSGDALQLAAALAWCEDQPSGETLVCLDVRLREAATREGFSVRPTTA